MTDDALLRRRAGADRDRDGAVGDALARSPSRALPVARATSIVTRRRSSSSSSPQPPASRAQASRPAIARRRGDRVMVERGSDRGNPGRRFALRRPPSVRPATLSAMPDSRCSAPTSPSSAPARARRRAALETAEAVGAAARAARSGRRVRRARRRHGGGVPRGVRGRRDDARDPARRRSRGRQRRGSRSRSRRAWASCATASSCARRTRSIAVAGGYGTLSEIALALKAGKRVVGLGTWEIRGVLRRRRSRRGGRAGARPAQRRHEACARSLRSARHAARSRPSLGGCPTSTARGWRSTSRSA